MLFVKPVAELLITFASTFQIKLEHDEVQTERVGYPFTVCGQTGISFISLTLDKTPTLNINLTATVVGTAKKDLALNYTGVLTTSHVPIQYDFKYTFQNGETINFTFTYQIPQFQTKGNYTVLLSFVDINEISEGCIYYKYTL